MSKTERENEEIYTENIDLLRRHIIFGLEDEFLSIPLEFIQEVLDIENIRQIPHLDKHVVGIINLRGEILSVLNLKYSIYEDSEYSSIYDENTKCKVIVIHSLDEKYGILVDEIYDILEFEDIHYKNIPSAVSSRLPLKYLAKIAKVGNDIIKIVNLKSLIKDKFDIDFSKEKLVEAKKPLSSPKGKKVGGNQEAIERGEIDLSIDQKGALKEIVNIASGNAVVALTKLFKKQVKISMNIENLIIKNINKIIEEESKTKGLTITIKSNLKNDVEASIFLNFPIKKFQLLLDRIEGISNMPSVINSIDDLNDDIYSAINEVGNIIISHYCSAMSDFLHVNIMHDVPEIIIDNYPVIIKQEFSDKEYFSEEAIILKSQIQIQKSAIDGQIVFIPHMRTLSSFINLLDVDKIVNMINKEKMVIDEENFEDEIFAKVTSQETFKLNSKDKKSLKINESDLDAFRELGNMGAGNAGNALSQMLNKKVLLEIPPAKVLDLDQLIEDYGSTDLTAGYIGSTKGLFEANIILSFPVTNIESLLQMIMETKQRKELRKESDLSTNEKSAVIELLNILMGHYIAAMGDFLKIMIEPPKYQFFFQNTRSLFEKMQFSEEMKDIKAIVIETALIVSDQMKVKGEFVLLLNSEVVHKILKRISELW